MAKRKIYSLILASIIAFNMASGISVKATENQNEIIKQAKDSFSNFKSQPIFNIYNETLRKIEKIEDENIKNPMLWELAPYWDEVATKYVTSILDDMIALSKDKNLLSFNELMDKIKISPLKTEKDNKWNEGYLMGELAAWSASGALFSKDEVIAIDSINAAWKDMSHENVDKAQLNIDKVINRKSKQWLQGEIDKIKNILKDKEKTTEPTEPSKPEDPVKPEEPSKPVVEYKDFKAKQDEKTGLWGYIKNSNGDWAIKPKFKKAFDFECEHAWVIDKSTDTCGVIDLEGNWMSEAYPLESLNDVNSNLLYISGYRVMQDEKTGLWGFAEYLEKINGKWVVTKWGIEPKFEAAIKFYGSYAWIKDKETGKTCLINETGEYVYSPEDNIGYLMFKAKQDEKTGLWGYIKNSNGDWVIKPQFKKAKDFWGVEAQVTDVKTNKIGFIDLKGEWTIPPIYTEVEE